MRRSRWQTGALLTGLLLAACSHENKTHTLKLEITSSDGEVRRETIKGPTSWQIGQDGHAISFPEDSESDPWFYFYFTPNQPGTYTHPTAGLILDGVAYTSNTPNTVEMEEITFTGKRAFPWEYKGRVTAVMTSGGGSPVTVVGEFTFTTDNCKNNIKADGGFACGGDFPWGYGDEDAEIDMIMPAMTGTCPQELIDLFVDGDTLTASRHEVRWGDAEERLECVETQPNPGDNLFLADDPERGDQGPYVCGATVKRAEADGCDDWRVSAVSYPTGADYGIYVVIGAGADCDGAPRTCMSASLGHEVDDIRAEEAARP